MIFNYDVSELLAQLNNIDYANAKSVTTASEDIDDYTNGGIYYFGSSYTPSGKPTGTSPFGFLMVIKGSSTQRLAQIWIDNGSSSNGFYVRVNSKSPPTWSSWEKLTNGTELSDAIAARFPSGISDCNIDSLGVVLASVTSSASNRPSSTSSRYGSMWHYASSSNQATQIYQEAGTIDAIWMRKKTNGTWGDWIKLITATVTQGTATPASTLPSGITAVDVKYVKCGQVVTVYMSVSRDSTSITSYVTAASGLPIPAVVPSTPGGGNYPLARISINASLTTSPLSVYVNPSGSLRVNYGSAEGTYFCAFTYITSDI